MEITKENIKELVGRRFGGSVNKDWHATITKVDCKYVYYNHSDFIGRFETDLNCEIESFINVINNGMWLLLPQEEAKFEESGIYYELPTPQHYDNTNGSLYLFAEQHGLNSYESDILKRIVRCRKKGEFLSDIDKMIEVLNLYLKEQGHKYEGQIEKLNK